MLHITHTCCWVETVMSFSCSPLVLWKVQRITNNVNYSCYIMPRKVLLTDTRVLLVTDSCKIVSSFKDKL